ncbi:MAG: ImmA/IrrE family metallo-endopeptidase [Ruminococcaceae bacterium]|nr:ImmA/IrrE family metallo-endopeptidase [Oscillospiraceae bacterium]MBQ2915269.1 hypothetical protein [Clostridia bacterium]
MDENYIRIIDLPSTVHGVTVRDEDGNYNIYINSSLSADARKRAIEHELKHINRGDFEDICSDISDLETNMP